MFASLLAALLLATLLPALSLAESFAVSIPSRGVQMPAVITLPDSSNPPSVSPPAVVFAHGHNGSKDENRGFAAIADALADCGVASIRIDFAGCGESTESFQNNCLTTMKADLNAAVAYARDELDAPAVGLFGYSMGGRVILEALCEGMRADAVALLAPAADTQALIRTPFEDFSAMHAAARIEGFYPHRFGGNQIEELSLAWFDDLLRHDDPAAAAARAYDGPALVLYAQDDAIVPPAVCEHVAEMLDAETFDASGKGHGYGFFLENDPIREGIAQTAAEFFSVHLRQSVH